MTNKIGQCLPATDRYPTLARAQPKQERSTAGTVSILLRTRRPEPKTRPSTRKTKSGLSRSQQRSAAETPFAKCPTVEEGKTSQSRLAAPWTGQKKPSTSHAWSAEPDNFQA